MSTASRSFAPRLYLPALVLCMGAFVTACGDDGGSPSDTGAGQDATSMDTGISADTGVVIDSGLLIDAGSTDSGAQQDAAPMDTGMMDGAVLMDGGDMDASVGMDANLSDTGVPMDTGVGVDSGLADSGGGVDTGLTDSGVGDAGLPDTGTGTTTIGWTCDPTYYAGADGCDCGCGLFDPDCTDALATSCEYCDNFGSCAEQFSCAAIEPSDNAKCIVAVCGNGAIEPGETCDDTNTTPGDGCDASCQIEIPTLWTCDPAYFTDGYCDCGCGAFDADCVDATTAACEFCDDIGSCSESAFGCPGYIAPTNNSTCTPALCGDGLLGIGEECDDTNTTPGDGCSATCLIEYVCGDGAVVPGESCDDGNTLPGDGCDATCQIEVPAAWTCDPFYYGDGLTSPFPSCDCGCGVRDIDCADATSAVCDYCDDVGSCSTAVGCPGTIDPTSNATCL